MSEPRTKADGCASCWGNKHKCERMVNGCCRRCDFHIRKGDNDDPSSIRHANPLNISAVHLLLHQGSQSKSPSTPDIYSLDSGSLTLRIRLPNGTTIQLILPLGGPFTTQNLDLIQVLDEFIEKHFSARLLGKTGCFLVGKASLTGGYLHFLCSTAKVVEVEESAEDHVKVENSPGDHILGAKVKYLLVCRLVELVSELLKAIRPQQDLNRGRDWISNAYAASVVLHYELYYFKCGVRSGLLKNNFSEELRGTLVDWFQSVDSELVERIHEGCGRFRLWRAPIAGSVRKLRRHHTPLHVSISLQLSLSAGQGPRPLIIVEAPSTPPPSDMDLEQDLLPTAPILLAPSEGSSSPDSHILLPQSFEDASPYGRPFNDLPFDNMVFNDLGFQDWSFADKMSPMPTNDSNPSSGYGSSFQETGFQDWTFLDDMHVMPSYDLDHTAQTIDNKLSSKARSSEAWSLPSTTLEIPTRSRNPSMTTIEEDFFQDMDSEDWKFLTSNPAPSTEDHSGPTTSILDDIPNRKQSQGPYLAPKLLPFDNEWTNPTKAHPVPHSRAPSSHHSPAHAEPGELQDMEMKSPRYFSQDLFWDYLYTFDETLN